MPIRSPIAIRGSRAPGSRARTSIGPSTSELPFSGSPMPSACVSLPGPEQSSPSRATPRRARIVSIPALIRSVCPIGSCSGNSRVATFAPSTATALVASTAWSSKNVPRATRKLRTSSQDGVVPNRRVLTFVP